METQTPALARGSVCLSQYELPIRTLIAPMWLGAMEESVSALDQSLVPQGCSTAAHDRCAADVDPIATAGPDSFDPR